MKLLSIAIPCYNSQDYMENCIESLLVGGEEVEILVIDDGSSDRTAEIADAYARKYPTIVKVIHQENGGHGEAVNSGIRNATGLYFKVVDSDDWVNNTKVWQRACYRSDGSHDQPCPIYQAISGGGGQSRADLRYGWRSYRSGQCEPFCGGQHSGRSGSR